VSAWPTPRYGTPRRSDPRTTAGTPRPSTVRTAANGPRHAARTFAPATGNTTSPHSHRAPCRPRGTRRAPEDYVTTTPPTATARSPTSARVPRACGTSPTPTVPERTGDRRSPPRSSARSMRDEAVRRVVSSSAHHRPRHGHPVHRPRGETQLVLDLVRPAPGRQLPHARRDHVPHGPQVAVEQQVTQAAVRDRQRRP